MTFRKLLVATFATLFLAVFSQAKDPAGPKKIDVDLSRMSGTVVYGMVYQMVTYPERFVGKRVRMKGVFSTYYDNEIKQRFFGCVISDALACCSQGLAFELSKPRKFPDEFPDEGTPITITGDFVFGDVNGDGSVNIYDVTEIQRFLADFGNPYHIGEPVRYDEYELPLLSK